MMQAIGYVPHDGRNNGIRNATYMAMLLQRGSYLTRLKPETLKHIAESGPSYLRAISAALPRMLATAGVIEADFYYQ